MGKESFSNLFGDNLTSDGRTAADAVGMPLSVEAKSDGGPLAALAATRNQGGQVSLGGRGAMLNRQMSGSNVVFICLLQDICDLTEPENQGMLGEESIWSGNLRQ